MAALVEYSSSDEEELNGDETTELCVNPERSFLQLDSPRSSPTKGRKRRSPMYPTNAKKPQLMGEPGDMCSRFPSPFEIKNLFNSSADDADRERKDDPSLHSGRVRSFAHERGNWASYVSIPFDEAFEIQELIATVIARLKPVAEFHPVDDLHISVSKTFVLQHHWILPIVENLKRNLSSCSRGSVQLGCVEFYCNEECTRYKPFEFLQKAVDRALAEYRLPEYYKDPKFHLSIAWTLGDVRSKIDDSTMESLQDVIRVWSAEECDISRFEVTRLRLKTGNRSFVLELPLSEKSIL